MNSFQKPTDPPLMLLGISLASHSSILTLQETKLDCFGNWRLPSEQLSCSVSSSDPWMVGGFLKDLLSVARVPSSSLSSGEELEVNPRKSDEVLQVDCKL